MVSIHFGRSTSRLRARSFMYACEGVAGTYPADESITDTAARLGWTVISIKDDWSTVFAPS